MIVNGAALLLASPVAPMPRAKHKEHGASWGLSEAGIDVRLKQSVTLHPFRRFSLASTVERFDLPEDLVGILHDKSTHIRRGLLIGNSVLEPGWGGHLTLELFYMGISILHLPAGIGIGQVIFHQLAHPAKYLGKYSDQPDKPVEAKYD